MNVSDARGREANVVVQKITSLTDAPYRDFIYDVLRRLPLELAVDVGAAAGEHTRHLRKAGAKVVVSFEPYPGNHVIFERETAALAGVRLIRKAVSDRVDATVPFIVPSVVQGDEPGWQDKAGYSSVGFVADRVPTLKRLKWTLLSLTARATRQPAKRRTTIIQVPTTTLDHEFDGETIDYLKVDVQGSEADVLRGAAGLLSSGRIGTAYIEWSGAADVPSILARHGYAAYDSVYLVGGRVARAKLERIGFKPIGEVPLSIGRPAVELVLTADGPDPARALAEAKRSVGWIQTDLIALSRTTLTAFREAVAALPVRAPRN